MWAKVDEKNDIGAWRGTGTMPEKFYETVLGSKERDKQFRSQS